MDDATQRSVTVGVVADLEAVGLSDAEPIGQGGFGIVYRCLEKHLGRAVAVKLLLDELAEDEDRERFLREQQAMARLSGHPNIVDVYQAGVTNSGKPFIMMPFYSSGSLETRLRSEGPLPARDVLSLGVKLAGALETAHLAGILHRDVKPSNILISDYGEPLLTDFGIAHMTGGFETATGAITGSPAFTAPEVLSGRTPTPRSDVYSLGASLFCLLTGHAVFERREGEKVIAQFVRIVNDPVPDLRGQGLPAELCTALEHALSADPGLRPASAAEFGDALRDAERELGLPLTEMAISSRRATPPAPDTPRALTPPVAATKYRPPPAAHALVERNRLIETLREGGRRRLVLIHAPAGFGKSTLAVQWREELVRERVPVAWLSVDNDDNNVVWFGSHLLEAIQKASPGLANGLIQMLEAGGPAAVRGVFTLLINEIHEAGKQVVLVVDDWHLVEDPESRKALAGLLDAGCHHLQIVVTSRSQAGLPLGRLRVRDELIEIDSAALRFDGAECRSFLVDRGGIALADDAVEELHDSTEGWIAALQLAALSLRGQRTPSTMLARITKDHRAIEEYLVENVLDSLEPELLDFMLAISVTDRTCGELASVLAGVPDAQGVLDDIERRELFLRRTDEDWEWMRFHHIFRDYLRRKLHTKDPAREVQLHKMASLWLADNGLLKEAVDHALAAGETDRAVDLVETTAPQLLERAQMATLLGLLTKLPLDAAVGRPRLLVDVAWANSLLNHVADSSRALDLAAPDADDALRAETDVIRATTNCIADRVDGALELVSGCLSHPDDFRPFVVSAAAACAAYVDYCQFDFLKAIERQAWTRPFHRRMTAPFGEVYSENISGMASMEMLDVAAAEEHYRRAMALAHRTGDRSSFASRIGGAQLGELLYLRGDIDSAEPLLDASHELGFEGGVVAFKIATFATGAQVKAARGDLASARRLLDEGTAIGRAMNVPRIGAHMALVRIKLGIDDGSDVRMVAGAPMLEEVVDEVRIRRLVARGEFDAACSQASELVGRLQHGPRAWAHLNAQLVLAFCLASAGRLDEARPVLTEAMETCSRVGLVRPLVDAGAAVQELVASLR
ncbi:serine/threonine-protein kinase [Smaragdicoccus niigatensis]|uniref:serine/threonine-protein kinase n=1 Tax=Smaragdicoccus niigatensis TaxID=359359 RepID=UPI000380411F|nr:serine/threonine-protein kinase [Smaragdicoccus niigatensis]